MAARLVKRCTCLLRAATRLAPAGPPAGRLRLARVAHRTLASSAASPSSHVPGSLSQHVEKEQVFTPYPERQEVDELIEKATRPEELLGLLGGGRRLHQNHAALALVQLSRLLSEKPEDKAPLLQDARFQQLLHLVNSQITAVWHGTLVKLLRSLYALELPASSKELRSVEQEVRWRLRRLRYKHLAFLAETSAAYMQERGSRALLAELLLQLERRWAEIEDSRTLVAVMTKMGHLSGSLMTRLEDKGPRCMGPRPPGRPDPCRLWLTEPGPGGAVRPRGAAEGAGGAGSSEPAVGAPAAGHLLPPGAEAPPPDQRRPAGPDLRLRQARLPPDPGAAAPGRRPAAPRAWPHVRRGGPLRQVFRLPQVAQLAPV